MINVKRTIYNNLNKGFDRLRLLADNNPHLFKKILSLIVLDDVYDWSEYLDDHQSILKKLRDLRTDFILCNQDLDVCKFPVGSDYVNVNTPQSDDTWNRVWDNKDVITLNSTDGIEEYLALTDLDEVRTVDGSNYLYVDKDGYVLIQEDTVNPDGYIVDGPEEETPEEEEEEEESIEGIVMQFNIDDPGTFIQFAKEDESGINISVTVTKNGETTTTEYQNVNTVDIQSDANTDIIITGDFTDCQVIFIPTSLALMEGWTKLHMNCTGIVGIQAYCGTDNIVFTNTESLIIFGLYSNAASWDFSKYQNVQYLLLYSPCESIDLTPLSDVKYLDLTTSNLTSLDLSRNVNLEEFKINNSSVVELDFSHNLNMKEIEVYGCSTETIMLGTLHNLDRIWIENCPNISVPDTSGCDQMTQYYFRNSGSPTTIDISNNPTLESVSFTNNSTLSTIDFSNNISLKSVNVEGSSLHQLDLSNNPAITWVGIVSCPLLTILDCSSCTGLHWIDTYESNELSLPSIQTIKLHANDINVLGCLTTLYNNCPVQGTLYLDSTDTYYANAKSSAESRGWTVQNL